jgi:ribonuclease HI
MKCKGYFDGSSRGNPGPAQCGWAILDDQGTVIDHKSRKATEHRTNNYAEYLGLIELLKYLSTDDKITHIDIYGDSKLVIMQVTGKWKCKSSNLKPLWVHAVKLYEWLTSQKYITLQWVPREQNTIADSLAQKGIL